MPKPDLDSMRILKQANADLEAAVSEHKWAAASIITQADEAARKVQR